MLLSVLPLLLLAPATPPAERPPDSNTRAKYTALTSEAGEEPPFAAVTLAIGPVEAVDDSPHVWWQLDVHARSDASAETVVRIQALTDRMPYSTSPVEFVRYHVQIPQTQETLEFANVHTGRALLPAWQGFAQQFFPRAARATQWADGFPRTCHHLGHVLSLRQVETHTWHPFKNVKTLALDPELQVGTARDFKDAEGRRLPNAHEQDYTYTPFTQPDFELMFEAGINVFCVTPDQEAFVRSEPVFYLGRPGRKDKKKSGPRYRFPADLYRSNLLGTQMFLDEPATILMNDEKVNRRLWHTSDAIALLQSRIRAQESLARSFERQLADAFHLGDLTLINRDYPVWEVQYYTAAYQMEAGLAGFVHEGRYRLDGFDERIGRWTGRERRHTVDEMLRYYYAFLRGGPRAFDKFWGTAIYGQADPSISPRAMAMAYDMGARYLWFWTSDHEHHLPWNEQVELARELREHAAAHPRGSIHGLTKELDLVIVIPYGYFLSLDELSWIRELNRRGDSEALAKHRRVMQRAHVAIDEALASGADFDIAVDMDRPIKSYKKIVRISDAP